MGIGFSKKYRRDGAGAGSRQSGNASARRIPETRNMAEGPR